MLVGVSACRSTPEVWHSGEFRMTTFLQTLLCACLVTKKNLQATGVASRQEWCARPQRRLHTQRTGRTRPFPMVTVEEVKAEATDLYKESRCACFCPTRARRSRRMLLSRSGRLVLSSEPRRGLWQVCRGSGQVQRGAGADARAGPG